MVRIIAIANQKGGTGKTTTAINLGTFLTAFGKKVLLVDIDSQANATSGLGVKPENLALSMYHALIGKVPAREVRRSTGMLSFDLLPASADLAGVTVELISVPDREFQLQKVLEPLKDEYDYMLIDCPPSLGLPTVNGLVAADQVLLPVQAEYFALQGIRQLLDTIELIRRNLGVPLGVLGAFLTMYDRRSRLARDVAKELHRTFPGYVFEAIIPRNVDLAESPAKGKSVFEYSPHSAGANAYRQLAQEILRQHEVSVEQEPAAPASDNEAEVMDQTSF